MVGGCLVVKAWAQSGDLLYGTVPTLRYSAVSQYQGCEPIQLTDLRSFRRLGEEQRLTGSGRLAWKKALELVTSVELVRIASIILLHEYSARDRVMIRLIRRGVQARVGCSGGSLILGCDSLSEVKVFGREQNALSETDLIRIVLILVPLFENIICKAAYDPERRRPEWLDLAVCCNLPCPNRGMSDKSVRVKKVERPILREASLCRNPQRVGELAQDAGHVQV